MDAAKPRPALLTRIPTGHEVRREVALALRAAAMGGQDKPAKLVAKTKVARQRGRARRRGVAPHRDEPPLGVGVGAEVVPTETPGPAPGEDLGPEIPFGPNALYTLASSPLTGALGQILSPAPAILGCARLALPEDDKRAS